MKKIFEKVQSANIKKSGFDLSHERKLSTNMGDLTPILVQEVLPSDSFKGNTEVMMRLAPMIAPVMHRVNVFVHYFFVPNRILDPTWEEMITGGVDGEAEATVPTLLLTGLQLTNGSIYDHMGVNKGGLVGPQTVNVNKLPFMAYNQIWNDYYRDPTLQEPKDINVIEGALLKRCWEKDYFTSCLPFPQRGPAVPLPIDGDATVNYLDASVATKEIGGGGADAGAIQANGIGILTDSNANTIKIQNIESIAFENINATINDLRESSALQRWLERQARGGHRYIETIKHHFNQSSSDARLQRAEYIGGGKQPIVISEVLNTSATETEPQGNMSGHGISTGSTNSFRYKAEEHGYIIGIMSVLPRTAYQQGVPRHFFRSDRFDFYWPEFANLGEQAVFNKELYLNGTVQDGIFGYQQRWAEYKYAMDTVHGDFKDTLDFWHMSRIFTSGPVLNESFVEADPTNRIFAVDEGDHLWVQIYNNVKAIRPMPFFSNPTLR